MKRSVEAADPPAHAADRRPHLLSALIRRELDAVFGIVLALAAAVAIAAAYSAYGPGSGGALPLFDSMQRRFDYTTLAMMAAFVVLRTSSRIEADHADGWLAPWLAAGGSRVRYGAGTALSSLLAPAAVFAATAAVFAISVTRVAGNDELLQVLPRTIGSGVMLLATYSVCTTAIGVLLRRSAAIVVVTAVVVALPVIVLVRFATAEGTVPLWAVVLPLVSPLLVAPSDTYNVLRATVYVIVVSALVAGVAHRYAGRVQ
ncbi:MAG TPA: hypothetical protein VK933_15655 [Longimicrobiales bacterium]|nr:hypothetical protein [Longimicrobiales bacterium]